MSSNEPAPNLGLEHHQVLFDVARTSIETYLTSGRNLHVDLEQHPPPLQAVVATFVTLRIKGQLRGCMGSLKATEPLITNVARNAHSAAFRDPRFSPVTAPEFPQLNYHISILSTPESLEVSSEADLLAKVRPGLDGLILYEGKRRGTLLPSVWEHVPEAREFLIHLKNKAGLAPDYWSESIRVERYTTQSISYDPPVQRPGGVA